MPDFHFSPRPNRAHEIAWREWSDSAFAEAREQDKPILLGISAVWCHWCHVMDETSYSDPVVIQLVNERFIPIRVDNDQRPDVNRRYNLGGWPTTAFLTPDGELLTGGTYVPPEQMRAYLIQVSEAYRQAKPDILQKIAVVNARRAEVRNARSASSAQLSDEIVAHVLRDIRDNFDPLYGGWGTAPKFPQTDALELVLEKYHATRDESLLSIVIITLKAMARGGIYDQEAGGFFRYSTTRDWSIPHLEKMLEDNAKLLALYAHAYQVTHDEAFLMTIRTLTAYVDSMLTDHARGGFHGSQDADEHYYALALAERAELPSPYVDRTCYTDWNSLMVSAFLDATRVLNEERMQTFALRTLERIWRVMYRADAGLFHFCREDGTPQLLNQLSDLARTTRALLDAYQTTGDAEHLMRAQTLANLALDGLYDAEEGAFWSEPRGRESLGLLRLPDKSLNENAAMADALTRLCRFTDEGKYRDAAERTLAFFASDYARYGLIAAEYARAVDHFLNEPVAIHVVGAAEDARTRALYAAALAEYAPVKIVQLLDPARDAARLAQLGYPARESPLAYVCVGQRCLAPISDTAEIVKEMNELHPAAYAAIRQ